MTSGGSPRPYRDLRRLEPQSVSRVVQAVEGLRTHPLPRGSRKLIGTEDHRRPRVGELRVIYKVEHETRAVVIIHVRHRKDAYR